MNAVSVIVPAYNEADIIAQTIAALQSIPNVGEIIVVDDGSSDDTAQQAERAGATKVIRLERNQGKGAALMAGLKEAKGDVLLLVDADLADCAANLQALLTPVLNGEADMTIATPISLQAPKLPGCPTPMPQPPNHPNTQTPKHPNTQTPKHPNTQTPKGGFGLAKGLARWAIRKMTGFSPTAPLSGQRAIKRWVIEKIGGFAFGFGVETALTIDALRCGARVMEVPVELTHRFTARNISGFLHRGRQLWHILLALLLRFLKSK